MNENRTEVIGFSSYMDLVEWMVMKLHITDTEEIEKVKYYAEIADKERLGGGRDEI